MIDISLFETGTGGDLVISGNDVERTDGLFNLIYIAMFGGNTEPENKIANQDPLQERKDFWGNEVLFQNEPTLQYVSSTERVMREVALNSAGRQAIEAAARKDLQILNPIANIESVTVSIIGVDKAEIRVVANEKEVLQRNEFKFIWDGARLEIIVNKEIPILD